MMRCFNLHDTATLKAVLRLFQKAPHEKVVEREREQIERDGRLYSWNRILGFFFNPRKPNWGGNKWSVTGINLFFLWVQPRSCTRRRRIAQVKIEQQQEEEEPGFAGRLCWCGWRGRSVEDQELDGRGSGWAQRVSGSGIWFQLRRDSGAL